MTNDPDQTITSTSGDVLCRAEGACGRITLNRPRALNALTNAMRSEIASALTDWQRDPMIYCVVIDAVDDGPFCAGGDLRELAGLAREDMTAARAAIAAEYALNWQIEIFTKPVVSLINGICMGSGVGLTAFGTHRVAGEGYRFAMPETSIGFFPDVGATWLLTRLPQRFGLYLGLSGRTINRGDALDVGFVTHCIPAAKFDDILAALQEAEPVDVILDTLGDNIGTETSRELRADIETVFDAGTIPEILSTLDELPGSNAGWAGELAAELRTKSPTSLAVTREQLHDTPPADLRAALTSEYRHACRFLEGGDLYEGIRALLVDKDKKPVWEPADLHEIDTRTVQSYFTAPASGDLELPPRPPAIAAIN